MPMTPKQHRDFVKSIHPEAYCWSVSDDDRNWLYHAIRPEKASDLPDVGRGSTREIAWKDAYQGIKNQTPCPAQASANESTERPMTPAPCPAQAYVYNGHVTRVIDGDTCDITLALGLRITTTQRLRLVNVNAPEMHGPSRVAGLAARDYTRSRLEGRDVVIRTLKSDVFGRWLGHVWVETDGAMADFNAELMAKGFAVLFMEGTGGV